MIGFILNIIYKHVLWHTDKYFIGHSVQRHMQSGCLIIGNVTFNDLVKVVTTSSLQHKGKFSSLLLPSSQWGDSLALCEYLCHPVVSHIMVLVTWLPLSALVVTLENAYVILIVSLILRVLAGILYKEELFSSSKNKSRPSWKGRMKVLITSFQSKELVLPTGLVQILAVCIRAILLPPEEANECRVCCVLPVLMINS